MQRMQRCFLSARVEAEAEGLSVVLFLAALFGPLLGALALEVLLDLGVGMGIGVAVRAGEMALDDAVGVGDNAFEDAVRAGDGALEDTARMGEVFLDCRGDGGVLKWEATATKGTGVAGAGKPVAGVGGGAFVKAAGELVKWIDVSRVQFG